MTDIKFCGLTRPEDAALAAALGARYAGVIFAGGPRQLTPARAREVLAGLRGRDVMSVGVFGGQAAAAIAEMAADAGVDGVQLAGGVSRDHLIALRQSFSGPIWAVLHTDPATSRPAGNASEWYDYGCEAVVLDAAVPGKLGGTGMTLDWAALAPAVARLRGVGRVVLAGGLRPENVQQAVQLARPDVVDVSSGVESAPGIKDPERMRAFVAAVRAGEV